MCPEAAIPRVWALLGDKAGDNAQVEALMQAIGEPWRPLRLRYNALYRLPNPVLGASLKSLDREASDRIDPPWPKLLVAVGRRSVPVARWIKQESRGGTSLVHLGRPRVWLGWFDLVVSTPQYDVPQRENVVQLDLPLVQARAAEPTLLENWQGALRNLARPWIAVLAGGAGRPFGVDADAAHRLARETLALAERLNGTLLVTTSPRTPPAAADILCRSIGAPHIVHRFGDPATPNPLSAWLRLADAFVVTADSVSMVAEAVTTGKPVFLFELPERMDIETRWRRFATRHLPGLVEAGWLSAPRSVQLVHQRLLRSGYLWRLADAGERLPESGPIASPLPEIVERIRAILEG